MPNDPFAQPICSLSAMSNMTVRDVYERDDEMDPHRTMEGLGCYLGDV